jgi:U3 small nucleolar ribonucleoprotein protein LCP5
MAATLPALLAALTESVKSAIAAVPTATSTAPPAEGISLFDTKNELLLSYLQNLVFLIILKLRNVRNTAAEAVQEKSDDIQTEIVKKLVELRVYLEKGAKPLESRLRYQIDKVIRAADEAELKSQTPVTATNRITKKPNKKNGLVHGSDDGSASEISVSEDEEDEETEKIDPLAYRPNPSALVRPSAPTGRDSAQEGIYRPPRITPVSLPTTTPANKEKSSRPNRSTTLDEFVATELSGAPVAEPSIGSTIRDRGRNIVSAKERASQRERDAYEESNYTRLPTVGKKDKKNNGARNAGYGGEEWRDIGMGAERVTKALGRGNKTSALERSRKRPREDSEGGGSRMGEAFEKRKKVFQQRENRRKG